MISRKKSETYISVNQNLFNPIAIFYNVTETNFLMCRSSSLGGSEAVGRPGETTRMVLEAAKTLDEVLSNLEKNFSESTEYFQVWYF